MTLCIVDGRQCTCQPDAAVECNRTPGADTVNVRLLSRAALVYWIQLDALRKTNDYAPPIGEDFMQRVRGEAVRRGVLRLATERNTTQRNTTQRNTTQRNTTQHNGTQHNGTQHNTTQHNTTQHG